MKYIILLYEIQLVLLILNMHTGEVEGHSYQLTMTTLEQLE